MITQDYSYKKTLKYFLENSDEDSVDSDAILQFLSKHLITRNILGRHLRWLDIGTGPATKIISMLKMWSKYSDNNLPSIHLLDPSKSWLSEAKLAFEKAGFERQLNRIYECTWEEFIEGKDFKLELDIITFLHSIYGFKVQKSRHIKSLKYLEKFLCRHGWACFAIESPKSDLYEIKREVYPLFTFKLVDYNILESTFKSFGWKYFVSDDLVQKFYLGMHHCERDKAINNYDAISFVIQATPEKCYEEISTEKLNAIKKAVDKRLKSDNLGWYIFVHDRIYWTQCRKEK